MHALKSPFNVFIKMKMINMVKNHILIAIWNVTETKANSVEVPGETVSLRFQSLNIHLMFQSFRCHKTEGSPIGQWRACRVPNASTDDGVCEAERLSESSARSMCGTWGGSVALVPITVSHAGGGRSRA